MVIDSVCIVGGGAIGGILAYYLYRGGVEEITVYYGSWESVEKVSSRGGLRIVYGGREYHVPVKPRHYSRPGGVCEYVLNAVKAYHVPHTIDLMREISSKDSLIVVFQNGFGSLELVEEKFPDRDVAGAVVFIGAERRDRDFIIHHGGETIYAGCRRGFCDKLLVLRNVFIRGGCDFRVVSDIDFYRWIKLAVNAVINPLTAIARSKNKIVLSEAGRSLARMILEELVMASRKHGYDLDVDRLYKMVLRSASNTAENYSSMAQDILGGRKTEIDYINGFIASIIGERSVNGVLTRIIHLIEEANRV